MRPNGAVARVTGPESSLDAGGDAIDSLYRSHAIGLVRLALVLTGDRTTAEDVVQDSFLGLFRGWSRLRDPDRALGYLRTSVVNGCRSVQRARKASWLRGEPPLWHEPPVWSAEAAAIAGEDQRAVLAAVAGLPRRQREVLALRYYAGLGDGEIASVLGVSRGTVSSPASRALRTRPPASGAAMNGGPVNGQVSDIEDRLRDAYRAAADTIKPDDIRDLREPVTVIGGGRRRSGHEPVRVQHRHGAGRGDPRGA